MLLGAFSVSLKVKNLMASRDFYEKLGFSQFGGSEDEKWLIMKNGDHLIGLFQDSLQTNVLTFNPGWDQSAQPLNWFDSVRVIQKNLIEQGVTLDVKTDAKGNEPGHIQLTDPDGNVILIDQHQS